MSHGVLICMSVPIDYISSNASHIYELQLELIAYKNNFWLLTTHWKGRSWLPTGGWVQNAKGLGTVLSKSLGSAFRRISWLFGTFRRLSTKFRFKRKFGDISANFRDAYCPNPRELSNDISLCSKYRGENSAKMRSSRKFVANFRANFRSVLQAFLRKVQTPWSKYESSFCCGGVKHSQNLFADFSL